MENKNNRRAQQGDDDSTLFFVFILSFLGIAFIAWIFTTLYAGGGEGRMASNTRVQDINIQLTAELSEIYNGQTLMISPPGGVQRTCSVCHGSGGLDDSVITCPHCQGAGQTVTRVQLGPGFTQQFRQSCQACGGSGKIIKNRCPKCHGDGVYRSGEEVSIPIEKGTPEGYVLRLSGVGHDVLNVGTGDIVVKINSKPHPLFKRDGDNLHFEMTISLKDALLGFEQEIVHLDQRKIKIRREEVTSPETIEIINGEGMYIFQSNNRKGDLYIHFNVLFPHRLTPAQKTEVRRLLPRGDESKTNISSDY